MGRELKRVPLNFEWEINKLWSGYINPHKVHECQECKGNGNSKEYEKLNDEWYSFENAEYKPTPQEVNEWNIKGMGHDSINAWICIKARLKREGKTHLCSKCKGSGENWQHPKAKSNYKNWKSYEPPTGEGFQLWTTTNEGSPMTPVFESLEKLCEYCEKEKVSVFGYKTATKEEWMKMLDDDFVYHKEGNIVFI